LGVDIFVPVLHGIFVRVADDEIVDDTWVTFPEDLDAIETRFLKADDVRDIGHVNPALQLKTGFSFPCESRLVFVHHELSLLFIRIDVLAAQKDTLE
jgi:hypothetical protein